MYCNCKLSSLSFVTKYVQEKAILSTLYHILCVVWIIKPYLPRYSPAHVYAFFSQNAENELIMGRSCPLVNLFVPMFQLRTAEHILMKFGDQR